MGFFKRVVVGLDAFQRDHAVLAFPYAVVKKFGDDQAGKLAALIAYYGFFSLFPLLLVFVTVLGILLSGNADLRQDIVDSAFAQFPVIGDEIRNNIGSIEGNGLALGVGIAGTLWAGLGGVRTVGYAMNSVWNVPMRDRPNMLKSVLRAIIILAVVGVAAVAAALVSGFGSGSGSDLSFGLRAASIVASAVVNFALFLFVFKVLTVADVGWRDVLPGAVIAGVAWTALQALGGYLVSSRVQGASDTYGFFALVIGLLTWLYLGAQMTLFAAEINVVRARKLWPRSIMPPLTEPEKEALAEEVHEEKRRPSQTVKVEYDPSRRDTG